MAFKWYEKYYNKFIDKICPDYTKSLDILVKNIPEKTKKIIELGCGTRNLTKLMAESFPKTEIIGYDKDKNQLDKASEKLVDYKNITLINQDASEVEIPQDSIVVSSLLLHLLEPEKRKALLQKLADSKVKEIYVFDRLKGETEVEERKYQKFFKENLLRHYLPTELIEDLIEENKTNSPDKLSEQKEFFEQRGYSLDIIYRNPNHGFIVYKIWR